MSSYGVATVGVGVGVVAVPVVLALAAGAAVVGTGVLMVRGVMWCGQKIEENYQSACQEWTSQQAAVMAESRMNVETINSCIQLYVAQTSAASYRAQQGANMDGAAGGASLPPGDPSGNQQELRNMLAHVRTMVADTTRATEVQPDIEHALLAARLRGEIASGRASLPPALITEAEQSLNGTTEQMSALLKRIEGAWTIITTEQALQQQTLKIIAQAEAQLVAMGQMVQDMGPSGLFLDPQLTQKHQIEQAVAEVRSHLIPQPAQAYRKAQAIEQALQPMLSSITEGMYRLWEGVRMQLNEQKGMLAMLELMLNEAEAIALVAEYRLAQLKERVGNAQNVTEHLLKLPPNEAAQHIQLLMQEVAMVKADVFNEVKGNQQSRVAHIVHETLEELGYGSQKQGTLTLQENGQVLLVEAMVTQEAEEEEPKDRLISFKVTRDGQISYDFSGYVGKQCLKDANEIFTALRAKGLIILDDQALEALAQLPAEQMNSEMLQHEHFTIKLEQNKMQSFLAEQVKGVLDQMGYSQLHESVIGGSIELEAFEGSIGYRVVLSPEGETRVYKDDAGNVSHEGSDPLVAKVLELQQQQEEIQIEREGARKKRGTIRKQRISQ